MGNQTKPIRRMPYLYKSLWTRHLHVEPGKINSEKSHLHTTIGNMERHHIMLTGNQRLNLRKQHLHDVNIPWTHWKLKNKTQQISSDKHFIFTERSCTSSMVYETNGC